MSFSQLQYSVSNNSLLTLMTTCIPQQQIQIHIKHGTSNERAPSRTRTHKNKEMGK